MTEKTVRKIFIFILILLPLQYIAVGVAGIYYSEPWPAFVFPGFKNVYVYEGMYELPESHFELFNSKHNTIARLTPLQLMPELPRSQIAGFMRTHFQDENSIKRLSDEAKNWLKEKSEKVVKQPVYYIEITYRLNYFQQNGGGISPDSTALQFSAVIPF